MTRAFAYLRVSTPDQLIGGSGHDRQLDIIQTFATAKGWTIARTFKDQQSGGDPLESREMLLKMLSLCDEQVSAKTIIVERIDRIARDLMNQEIFLAKCRDAGVSVYVADTGEEIVLQGQDPTRILLRQFLGAISQWEKNVIIKKLQDGRRRKAHKTGRPCGGRPAFGVYDESDQNKATLAFIVQRRDKGDTYQSICNELIERQWPRAEGGLKWHTLYIFRLYSQWVAAHPDRYKYRIAEGHNESVSP